METLEKNKTWKLVDLPQGKSLVGCKSVLTVKYKADGSLERFSKAMTIMGYNQSQGDHTLFINHSKLGGVTTLLVYVDDIIVIGNDLEEREALRCQLENEFEIKDLGKLKYFLGIEVAYSKRAIFISQHKYLLDLLKETGNSLVNSLKCLLNESPNYKSK
ncbi:hypothetical protein AAG906_025586 [Vitis piasezkii]